MVLLVKEKFGPIGKFGKFTKLKYIVQLATANPSLLLLDSATQGRGFPTNV